MLGYTIKPQDVKLIEKVNFIKEEFTATTCDIYINATMTYGLEEYFLVGRIFKDYKSQGNYTYINGVEKEFKTVRPVLNAIMKQYNEGLCMDKILEFTGLKKDIKETRMYKKLVAEELKKNEIVEVIEIIENIEVPEIVEVETIEVIENVNTIEEAPETSTELEINGQPIIYKLDNISIYANIQAYTSNFTNQSYNEVKNITIVKDNEIIYTAYNVCFPVNAPSEYRIIDFNNYAEYICKYIIVQENNNIDYYWTNINLNNLLMEKKTLNFDHIIINMKKKELEQIQEIERQQKQIKINKIITELETICTAKKLLLYKDYSNIIILKNTEYFNKKDRTLSIIKSCINSNSDNAVINYNQYFKQFELCNISLNYSNNLELLQDAKKLIS